MILPRPERPGQYVYFHTAREMDVSSGKVLYTEVDMNANGGKGKVTPKNRLLRGPHPIETSFTAVRHDWWIIVPEEYANVYNLYLMTPDTILGPYTQNWEDAEASKYTKTGWNVVFSPDGTKFVRVTLTWVDGTDRFNQIFIYDFDRCTGTLSNPTVLNVDDPGAFTSSAAISPNSRFLYFQIAQNKLFQFDLHAPDIAGSKALVGEYDGFVIPQGFGARFNAMALAPNGKIYMCCTSGVYYYHTIHAPDEPGLACDFRQRDIQLPAVNLNMPSYPNFRLYDAPGSPCDTLGINTPTSLHHAGIEKGSGLSLSPNPASERVSVTWPEAGAGRVSARAEPTRAADVRGPESFGGQERGVFGGGLALGHVLGGGRAARGRAQGGEIGGKQVVPPKVGQCQRP